MKSASFHLLVAAGLMASFIITVPVSAQAATKITCGYADSRQKLLEITHEATEVSGRDLLTTSSTDGSPVRSTFKVLKVVPSADVYEYDIHMTEKYSVGELDENPRTDHSVLGASDIRIELRLDLRHPENSDVHVSSHETIRDFSWEPGFMATHFNEDTTRKISCEVVQDPS